MPVGTMSHAEGRNERAYTEVPRIDGSIRGTLSVVRQRGQLMFDRSCGSQARNVKICTMPALSSVAAGREGL